MIPLSKPFIGKAEKHAVLETLESGMLAQGARTAAFEDRFARVCEVKHAIAVSSGTAALHLALLAHNIGAGDEVITTPFTFIASVNCILFCGAQPVLVDIKADTFNLDPQLVEAAITSKTRAILPVHLYGYPCNMDALVEIARRHRLILIEDAAQAIGATVYGKPVGSFGTGCFSLYATKNVTSGEGGMITTDDAEFARTCRLLRNHGMERRYHHERLGYNLRMTDLHAALGLAQLERLDEFTARRRANAEYFNAQLTRVITPRAQPGYGHVWHQYTIRVAHERDTAVQRLNRAGIGTGVFYPVPAHQQAHIRAVVGDIALPVAEQLAREVLSLPVHPQLSQRDLETIVAEVERL